MSCPTPPREPFLPSSNGNADDATVGKDAHLDDPNWKYPFDAKAGHRPPRSPPPFLLPIANTHNRENGASGLPTSPLRHFGKFVYLTVCRANVRDKFQ